MYFFLFVISFLHIVKQFIILTCGPDFGGNYTREVNIAIYGFDIDNVTEQIQLHQGDVKRVYNIYQNKALSIAQEQGFYTHQLKIYWILIDLVKQYKEQVVDQVPFYIARLCHEAFQVYGNHYDSSMETPKAQIKAVFLNTLFPELKVEKNVDVAHLPLWVNDVCDEIHKHGGLVAIAGGFVRDFKFGLPYSDIDLKTNLSPTLVSQILRHHGYYAFIDGGDVYPFVRVQNVTGSIECEISTFRVSRYLEDSRRRFESHYIQQDEAYCAPFETLDDTITQFLICEDATNIDITANACYLVRNQQDSFDLFAPFGIDHEKIKAIGDLRANLNYDPNRLFRMIHFYAKCQKHKREKTIQLPNDLKNHADVLSKPMPEAHKIRLNLCFEKLFRKGLIEYALPELLELNVLSHWIPELKDILT